MTPIDLHVHSICSDGSFTPSMLVDYAMEKGLKAFALTDHDTVAGLEEAFAHADELRRTLPAKEAQKVPEIIPGIELSSEYQGQDIHIVGLFIDYHNETFLAKLQEFVDSRTIRNQKMCQLLREAGIDITYEALEQEYPDSVITRAHYAGYMLKHGYISSIKEAFDRYVGDHCPCYIPREKITPAQAVHLILEAGGLPILAHPILYHMSSARLDILTSELKAAGLVGIEAVYSTYKLYEEREIRALASKYDLLLSGGSDFHGSNKPDLDLGTGYGKLVVPDDFLTEMKNFLFHKQ